MVDEMTWKAAMDSEIFRSYFFTEIQKEHLQKKADLQKQMDDQENLPKYLENLEKLEREIHASPLKLKTFRAWQQKFATDSNYTAKVDPKFVQAVMMLNLK